ncbi:MAG: NfeD family protein [Candidatus Thermoplasmatota archaeon]|nr:NfeD family protein [Candidatus Thermoplasmatota archaeon]MBS3789908.1 NfeD family protein [Candidatus Thermoplasmatota archaeon]
MIIYGVILIALGILLAIFEAADPGFFIAIPAGVLLTLGIITIAFPGILFTWMTPLIVAAIVIPLMFLSMRYYQHISPPSKPTTTMTTSLKGQEGKVVKEIDPDNISGKIRVGSKYWSATADENIEEGAKVKITEAKGVHVVVEKIE